MKVRVYGPERKALLIPEESVVTRGGSKFVYMIVSTEEGPRAELTEIETGERGSGKVEVLAGLKSGDQIVAHGTVRLRGGELLNIVESKE